MWYGGSISLHELYQWSWHRGGGMFMCTCIRRGTWISIFLACVQKHYTPCGETEKGYANPIQPIQTSGVSRGGPEWLPHRLYAQQCPKGEMPYTANFTTHCQPDLYLPNYREDALSIAILQTLWQTAGLMARYTAKLRKYWSSPIEAVKVIMWWNPSLSSSYMKFIFLLEFSSPQAGMGIWGKLCELVAVGPGGSGVRAAKAWYHLVAPGIGQLKPENTGSCHSGRPAFDFSTFPLGNIIWGWKLRVALTTPVKR